MTEKLLNRPISDLQQTVHYNDKKDRLDLILI